MRTYNTNQVIYAQGDDADSVFYVHSGKVKVVVLSEQGKEAVISIAGPGAFFGEGCLVGQVKRLATVTALIDCSIAKIAVADIIRVIHEEPAFAEMFIAHLLQRNARVEEDLVISYSIPVKSGSHEFCFFWQILAKTHHRSRSLPRSARRRWQKWSALRGPGSVFS